MADKKISELTVTTSLADADVFAIVDSGVAETKKITGATMRSEIGAGVGVNFEYFFSDTVEGIIGGYNLMYPNDTGEAESTVSNSIPAADTLIQTFITESDQPTFTTLVAGVSDVHIHAAKTAGTKGVFIYAEYYKRTSGGTETLLATTEISDGLTGSNSAYSIHFSLASDITLATTDRLVMKFYGSPTGSGTNPTVTLYLEGANVSRLEVKTTVEAYDQRYLVKEGLSGGQTAIGGTGNGEDLILQANSSSGPHVSGTVEIRNDILKLTNATYTVNFGLLQTDSAGLVSSVLDVGGVTQASTQAPGTNSKLLATTAYVDVKTAYPAASTFGGAGANGGISVKTNNDGLDIFTAYNTTAQLIWKIRQSSGDAQEYMYDDSATIRMIRTISDGQLIEARPISNSDWFEQLSNADAGDSGSNPMHLFRAQIGGNPITTRPLFGIYNDTTNRLLIQANGQFTTNSSTAIVAEFERTGSGDSFIATKNSAGQAALFGYTLAGPTLSIQTHSGRNIKLFDSGDQGLSLNGGAQNNGLSIKCVGTTNRGLEIFSTANVKLLEQNTASGHTTFTIYNNVGVANIVFQNGTTSSGVRTPRIQGNPSAPSSYFHLISDGDAGTDTGTVPLMRMLSRINGGAVTTRPLFSVENSTTWKFKVEANGTIANEGGTRHKGVTTITSAGSPYDALNVLGARAIQANTASADITIRGLNGAISGEEVIIFKQNSANNLIINHQDANGTQKIVTQTGANITLANYGGVLLRYNSTNSLWYVISY